MPDEEAAEFVDTLNALGIEFDDLCNKRHKDGIAEYGQFTFLENDVVRMMAEELADTANYCRMQFVKLMLINNIMVDELNKKHFKGDEGDFTIGIEAFKGTKKGWKK